MKQVFLYIMAIFHKFNSEVPYIVTLLENCVTSLHFAVDYLCVWQFNGVYIWR